MSSSFDLEGYAVFCGAAATPDETTAGDRFEADTGLQSLVGVPPSIAGSHPGDEFVFASAPTPIRACQECNMYGSVGAVAARSGLTVLRVRIAFDGPPYPGDLVYPATWKPASDLGAGCSVPAALPAARGFDFNSDVWGAKLDAASLHSALEAVWSTALPVAYARKQPVLDALVLRYATVLESQESPEYVVLVNSGGSG